MIGLSRRALPRAAATGLLLGVVAAVLTAGSGWAGSASGSAQLHPAVVPGPPSGAAPTPPSVRDGKFEFTVQKVKCGVSSVGSDITSEQAQGQFCLVTLKVKNIGDQPQTFIDSAQKGFDANGKEYQTNSMAGLAANQDNTTFINSINPGNQVTGVIVFDIPKDAKLVKLELHDSMFSNGATVQIG